MQYYQQICIIVFELINVGYSYQAFQPNYGIPQQQYPYNSPMYSNNGPQNYQSANGPNNQHYGNPVYSGSQLTGPQMPYVPNPQLPVQYQVPQITNLASQQISMPNMGGPQMGLSNMAGPQMQQPNYGIMPYNQNQQQTALQNYVPFDQSRMQQQNNQIPPNYLNYQSNNGQFPKMSSRNGQKKPNSLRNSQIYGKDIPELLKPSLINHLKSMLDLNKRKQSLPSTEKQLPRIKHNDVTPSNIKLPTFRKKLAAKPKNGPSKFVRSPKYQDYPSKTGSKRKGLKWTKAKTLTSKLKERKRKSRKKKVKSTTPTYYYDLAPHSSGVKSKRKKGHKTVKRRTAPALNNENILQLLQYMNKQMKKDKAGNHRKFQRKPPTVSPLKKLLSNPQFINNFINNLNQGSKQQIMNKLNQAGGFQQNAMIPYQQQYNTPNYGRRYNRPNNFNGVRNNNMYSQGYPNVPMSQNMPMGAPGYYNGQRFGPGGRYRNTAVGPFFQQPMQGMYPMQGVPQMPRYQRPQMGRKEFAEKFFKMKMADLVKDQFNKSHSSGKYGNHNMPVSWCGCSRSCTDPVRGWRFDDFRKPYYRQVSLAAIYRCKWRKFLHDNVWFLRETFHNLFGGGRNRKHIFLTNPDWDTGKGSGWDENSGDGGSGWDENSGDGGSGWDENSGDGSGWDENSGHEGSGWDENSGDGSGWDENSGHEGSGWDENSGDDGSGWDENSGDEGSGWDENSGDEGSGWDENSGDEGSGWDENSGDGDGGDGGAVDVHEGGYGGQKPPHFNSDENYGTLDPRIPRPPGPFGPPGYNEPPRPTRYGETRKIPPRGWIQAAHGKVPIGAFTAGINENNKAVYIGRAPFVWKDEVGLVPGMLADDTDCLIINWRGYEQCVAKYEILVGDEYIWSHIEDKKIHPDYVVAGYEYTINEILGVCRGTVKGKFFVAKFSTDQQACYFPGNRQHETKELRMDTYELLVQ